MTTLQQIKSLVLDEILDIVFDPEAVQPDAASKLNKIEAVLSFMMRIEDADDNTTYRLTEDDGK